MAEKSYDLVIVGSGPGGYVAAARAAQLGMSVACVEKNERLGGVCLNVGCIPSKALLDSSEHYEQVREKLVEHGVMVEKVSLDLSAMMARKEKVVEDLTGQVKQLLENNKVDIIHGAAKLTGKDTIDVRNSDGKTSTFTAKNILLATGSKPAIPPGLEKDGKQIITSDEALSLDAVPERLGIVGGGYIGLELGSVWRRLGSKVTVIEMLPQIAPGLDSQVSRRLNRILKKQGLDFRLNTKVTNAEVKDGEITVSVESKGKSDTLTFDKLLICVGRKPLTDDLGLDDVGVELTESGHVKVDGEYRTSVSNIFAIGDLIHGPALAHKASAEGRAAVEIMADKSAEVNYDVIPAVVYTWPEVSGVGMTEDKVKKLEIPYNSAMFPFAGVGRAKCMGEFDGFVKVLAHKESDRILGIHIIGPRASEMIAECAVAMEFGASSEDLGRTIHAHPTFAEGIMEAAQAVSGGH